MKKKITSILFVMVFVFNLAACGKEKTQTPSVKTLPLGDSAFAYTILYSEEDLEVLSDSISSLSLAIKKNFKKIAKQKADTKIKYSKDSYEILIGNTDRPESKEAISILENNRKNSSRDSIITVIGNKIVINSPNNDVLIQTIEWFTKTFFKNENSWSMLTSDYKYIYEYEDITEYKIGENSILNYSIVMRHDSSMVYGIYAEELQSLIEQKTCYAIELLNDESAQGQYEILIGNSAREETNISLRKNQYSIFIKDDKLVVVGYDDQATAFAVRKLIELFSKEGEGSIPANFSVTENFNPDESDYQLVYSDEFNTINRNYWKGYTRTDGTNQFGKTAHALGNTKVFSRDGMAVLPAWIDEKTKETYNSTLDYQGTHIWKYGIAEIRAKWAGYSSTYSFWFNTLQADYEKYKAPGVAVEYDVLENFGNPSVFHSNIHCWWKDKSASWSRHISLDGTKFAEKKKYALPKGEKFDDKFHTFSCRWSPTEIEFAVDGKTYFTYDLTDDWNGYGVEAYANPVDRLHITHGIGNASSYNKVLWKEGEPLYYEYLIDYYRIYQRNSDGGFSDLSPGKKLG